MERKLTPHMKKKLETMRSRRNINDLLEKLLDAIEERKYRWCERKEFYCTEADNLRTMRERVKEAKRIFQDQLT